MSHNYYTIIKKQEEKNQTSVDIGRRLKQTSVDIANLETKLLDGFSNLKDEAINVKDVIIRNLQEENAKLRSKVEVLENEFNHLEVQYCRRNDIEVSGIPDSIGDNELECSVIKIIKTIDIEDDYRNI